MWNYEKRLQYPVHISKCDPKAAMFIMSQYGGLYSITLVEKFLPYYIYQINPLDCCHRVYFLVPIFSILKIATANFNEAISFSSFKSLVICIAVLSNYKQPILFVCQVMLFYKFLHFLIV